MIARLLASIVAALALLGSLPLWWWLQYTLTTPAEAAIAAVDSVEHAAAQPSPDEAGSSSASDEPVADVDADDTTQPPTTGVPAVEPETTIERETEQVDKAAADPADVAEADPSPKTDAAAETEPAADVEPAAEAEPSAEADSAPEEAPAADTEPAGEESATFAGTGSEPTPIVESDPGTDDDEDSDPASE